MAVSVRGAFPVLALAAIIPSPMAHADVRQVRLGVKGATCATCAFALRKAFKRLDDVSEAKLATKQAVMEIRLKPGTWPNLNRMRQLVKETGFEAAADQVHLVVSGTLVRQDQGWSLDVNGMKRSTMLPVSAGADTKGIDLAAHAGETVELEGTWRLRAADDRIGVLNVKALRPAKTSSAK